MKDSKLLDEVIRYYLDSSSFNGLPIYEIENYDVNEMIELINDGFVEAISEVDVLNPHIKGFDLGLSKEHQIVYGSVRAIRILFKGHPLTKDVKIPDYLEDGKDIVFY